MFIYVGDQRMVDADFHARRWKLSNDGNPNIVYIRYDRWVGAQTYSLSGLPDPFLHRLRIQNFPYDSVEPDLIKWEKYRPAADLPDEGSCAPWTISYTVLGATASREFDRCGRYNMWRNVEKPSSYWIQWEGRAKGNREAAYSLVWVQKQGTARSQHDLQKIVMTWPNWSLIPDTVCTQTDSGRTCHL